MRFHKGKPSGNGSRVGIGRGVVAAAQGRCCAIGLR